MGFLDDHQPITTEHQLTLNPALKYTATAGWQPLFKRSQPVAAMFYVAYRVKTETATPRPLTFIFNGGPGAASAYLHMGALGPQRIQFTANGGLPRPPVQVVDNAETWLQFSDLVFIDPIGTGFSRAIPAAERNTEPKPGEGNSATQAPKSATAKPGSEADVPPEELPFWDVEQDLQSLGEFMQTWLSKQQRWLSPIFIAGESYGGFRVARLTNLLQRQFGIGLCGAILISPVLEFSLVRGNDYDLMHWATLIPTFAAAAAYHGKARYTATAEAQLDSPLTVEQNRLAAEQFCQRTLLPVLAGGCAIPTAERQAVYQQLADLIGLPPALVEQHQGRISPSRFARELLRQEQKIVGLYDAALTAIDPFPDRPLYEGSEPTLDSSQHLFTAAINQHLCSTLGVETDLTYRLLDFDVNRNWQFQSQAQKSTWRQGYVGAVDELRVGMTLNPALKIYLCHGYFDLVTTYAASSYLVNLMQLAPEIRDNLTVQNFNGGHMFYSWDQSRLEWFQAMQRFYERAIAADG